LTEVKITAARDPRLRVAMHKIVMIRTAIIAVSLIAHSGMSFTEVSPLWWLKNKRLVYSAKMRLIAALEPTFRN
jgi:hypothetical protein